MTPQLETMDSAPRDGTLFLVRYLPYGTIKPCMRRVRFDINSQGEIVTIDCGGWLFVHGITQIDEDSVSLPTNAEPEFSIASDANNDVSEWRWMPMPEAKDFPS